MSGKTLGEFISETREQRGLSLRELARQTGISPSFLSRIEHDRRCPSKLVMIRLADLLGVPVKSLQQRSVTTALDEFKRLTEQDRALYVGFVRIMMAFKQGKISINSLKSKLLVELD
jgi:transcriptional regulator with XRE-family HTH domain